MSEPLCNQPWGSFPPAEKDRPSAACHHCGEYDVVNRYDDFVLLCRFCSMRMEARFCGVDPQTVRRPVFAHGQSPGKTSTGGRATRVVKVLVVDGAGGGK